MISPNYFDPVSSLSSLAGILCCLALVTVLLIRDRRPGANRLLIAGLTILALEETAILLGARDLLPREALVLQRARWLIAAFLPGIWLWFSTSFARTPREASRWGDRWPVVLAFALPITTAILGNQQLFGSVLFLPESGSWVFPLAWAGMIFFSIFLLGCVAVLVNLEKTLLASTGRQTWQVKFLIFGVGLIFAVRIYTVSQTLLYSALDTQLAAVNSSALVIGCLLSGLALRRSGFLLPQVYLSRSVISGSITVAAVGVYLLAVALLAKAVRLWDPTRRLRLDAFLVFLTLCVLAILLKSDRLNRLLKRLVTTHFHRPSYDYRTVWLDFTRRTASILDEREFSRATVRLLSETLGMLSVTIWLYQEHQERLVLAGSTTGSSEELLQPLPASLVRDLGKLLQERSKPLDLLARNSHYSEFHDKYRQSLSDHRARYCLQLVACKTPVGLLTLGDRVAYESLTCEDLGLIQTVADQAAATLLNFRVLERVRQAHEQEALQNMAAFLVHDLKNLASTLSLTVQNLPIHFGNPQFREQSIRTIAQTVERMQTMCNRLSVVRGGIELHPEQTDLNTLLGAVIAECRVGFNTTIRAEFDPLPLVIADPEQIRKVIVNLLLNANQAMADGGEITVSTAVVDSMVKITVADSGPGMSADFVRERLFRPFQTTKPDGIGIGLFHCRMILEAHEGSIDAESTEGAGAVFRVLLPVSSSKLQSLAPRTAAMTCPAETLSDERFNRLSKA